MAETWNGVKAATTASMKKAALAGGFLTLENERWLRTIVRL